MRLSSRSYPHPVLGNADDVPGAAFQATFEIASDQQFYYITMTAACSSKTLRRLIAKNGACYVLHVECSNTVFRKAYEFTEDVKRVQIPASQLNETVEINAFVRAKEDIKNYKIADAHPDYNGAAFNVRAGDILAIGEGQTFDAESSFDSLRRIGSIMVIERSQNEGDHPMEVEFNADKIRILLCAADFESYSKLKLLPGLTRHLTTTIVLPVLIEAIHLLDGEAEGLESTKWFKILKRKIESLELEGSSDSLSKAQRVLDLPIRRALVAAETYAGLNN